MVSSKPVGRMYHQYMPIPKPELLMRSVKTKSALWWWSGTTISTPMMITTPTQCQNTEMLLNSATRCDEKMLIMACKARITTKTMKISPSDTESAKLMMKSSPQRLKTNEKNWAQNQSTVATIAIRPSRFNQPVNQDQMGPPSSFAHQ